MCNWLCTFYCGGKTHTQINAYIMHSDAIWRIAVDIHACFIYRSTSMHIAAFRSIYIVIDDFYGHSRTSQYKHVN